MSRLVVAMCDRHQLKALNLLSQWLSRTATTGCGFDHDTQLATGDGGGVLELWTRFRGG